MSNCPVVDPYGPNLFPQKWSVEEDYPYEPLPSASSIHLLKVEQSAEGEDVYCTMRAVDLDRRPRYTALSYTWRQQKSAVLVGAKFFFDTLLADIKGQAPNDTIPDLDADLKATNWIWCNGQRIKIYQNLYEALCQLKKTRAGDWYWIDAICMNQKYVRAEC